MKKRIILPVLLSLILHSCAEKNKPADAATDPGKEVYMKYCLACHQMDGSGVPGLYPPIRKTDWVEGDKTRLIGLLINGQQGVIIVNGKKYQGDMPSHQYLTDEQVAQVLTYIRSNYGNLADPVKPDEVAAVRNQSANPR